MGIRFNEMIASYMKYKLNVIWFVCCVLLSGCETASSITEPISDLLTDPIVLPCPEYRILADAAKFEKFKPGEGRALIDLDYETTIINMRLACKTQIEKDTRNGYMDISVKLDFLAKRGPENQFKQSDFIYFLSVTDRDYKILYREQFKIVFAFKRNTSQMIMASKPITLQLPITKNISSDNFIIFSGFQTSREQLLRNRKNKR